MNICTLPTVILRVAYDFHKKKITSCYTINPIVYVMEIWCFYEVRKELFKHTDAFCTLQMIQPNHLLLSFTIHPFYAPGTA